MIDSPIRNDAIKTLTERAVAAARQSSISEFLEARFGPLPPEVTARLKTVTDEDALKHLIRQASQATDLDSFVAHLP